MSAHGHPTAQGSFSAKSLIRGCKHIFLLIEKHWLLNFFWLVILAIYICIILRGLFRSLDDEETAIWIHNERLGGVLCEVYSRCFDQEKNFQAIDNRILVFKEEDIHAHTHLSLVSSLCLGTNRTRRQNSRQLLFEVLLF